LRLVVGSGEEGSKLFGRLLRETRVNSEKSAREVAAEVGVSSSFVRAVERGERAPSAESGMKLLHAVGISTDEGAKSDPFDIVFETSNPQRKFYIAFKASRQGDNTRWSLARLSDEDTGNDPR